MKNVIVLIFFHFISANVGQGQSFTVSGTVLYNPQLNDCFQEVPCLQDIALTKEEDWIPPKAAVNILVKGTNKVAKTDPLGKYSIEVSSNQDTLQFLYIGHNRLEVSVDGRKTMDIKLTPTPIPVIERLLGLIMPAIDAGQFPNIDQTAKEAQVNRATARDILWLVLGNMRMKTHYPEEFIPDYRFAD
ncbi:MAG: hypothetical protein HKN87_22045 [Saprospiraceae bacterium]|nr:hypothetical protein [Saprospiraceae bacterium]